MNIPSIEPSAVPAVQIPDVAKVLPQPHDGFDIQVLHEVYVEHTFTGPVDDDDDDDLGIEEDDCDAVERDAEPVLLLLLKIGAMRGHKLGKKFHVLGWAQVALYGPLPVLIAL